MGGRIDHAWTCRCCGKQFNELSMSYAIEAPHHWLQLPEAERQARGKIDSDVCAIDDDIFVRGCLEIPVIGASETFLWGLWVSVSKPSFGRILDLWEASDLDGEPPLFAWLCNNIEGYPPTLGLASRIYLRAGGLRPSIVLEPTDHPLAREQREGISLRRVEELVAALAVRH